ncbi:HAD-IA family hydrolase [Sinorhizobium meliloti]|jgi:phosphoglycolate phosphatase|uniref:HAD family hydrolase n=1 Tax=Rhizobium meliloti TaxID=382 RepID=UPI001297D818|nr:HAD family hydrolase [Sinorhizobium meliloti]MDW9593821.1 HAD-IA family hydrolase [Sinorhizobium meliloti]MDX0189019.1 HAD-IA family hydrolase [Sinorhizobium meliloti]MQV05875.1 HAD-IA family hydrolase [Sinorhizobium meliloti]MQV60474.1 HAD-IA family hydrolase [Sinorhizobium meliloti]
MPATKPIAGILFDKDGTLLDYVKSWVPVNYELARIAAKGNESLARVLLQAGGMDPDSGHVVPDSLLAAGNTVEIATGMVGAGAPFTVGELTALFDGLFAQSAHYAVPVTDLASFFAGLHAKGYRLGVASSDNERSIRETAKRFGFEDYLHYVAGYDSGFGTKPEPGMVLGFCAATGLAPDQVAVVGDNNHDMHMGRSAGVGMTVAVLTGTGSRQSLAAACDHCLADITELEAVLTN